MLLVQLEFDDFNSMNHPKLQIHQIHPMIPIHMMSQYLNSEIQVKVVAQLFNHNQSNIKTFNKFNIEIQILSIYLTRYTCY